MGDIGVAQPVANIFAGIAHAALLHRESGGAHQGGHAGHRQHGQAGRVAVGSWEPGFGTGAANSGPARPARQGNVKGQKARVEVLAQGGRPSTSSTFQRGSRASKGTMAQARPRPQALSSRSVAGSTSTAPGAGAPHKPEERQGALVHQQGGLIGGGACPGRLYLLK